MKKITLLLFAFIAILSTNVKASDGVIDLSGKTLTDMDGTVWDLGQLQADGKTIIFDFWATWCGPCIGSIPGLDDIWAAHGPAGDNTMVVFSIETDAGTSNEAAVITSEGITNPVFIGEDNADVKSNMFAYTGGIPYFTVVCPSGYWQDRVGGIGTNGNLLSDLSSECMIPVPNDDGMALRLTATIPPACPGVASNTWTPTFKMANLGTVNMTSATLEVKVSGTVIEIINWTGDLAPANEVAVAIAAIEFYGMSNQEVEVNIHNVNGAEDTNPNNDNKLISRGTGIADEVSVTLEVEHDSYTSEISWEIKNGAGVTVAASTAYTNGNQIPATPVTLGSANDCYSVKVSDSYGDGIGGGFKIKQGSTTVLSNYIEFEDDITDYFSFSEDTDNDGVSDAAENIAGTSPTDGTDTPPATIASYVDGDNDGFSDAVETTEGSDPASASSTPYNKANSIVDVASVVSFDVFPNPATDFITVNIETKNNVSTVVTLVDVLGRTVSTNEVSNNAATINTTNLNSGIYIVNIKSENKSIATSTVVVK